VEEDQDKEEFSVKGTVYSLCVLCLTALRKYKVDRHPVMFEDENPWHSSQTEDLD
jgi:hypothetical protein